MKKIATIMTMIAALFSGTAFAATNYFTGAVNNQTQIAGNWSLGVITDWDDAIVADWSLGVMKTAGTAQANMYYNTLTFNTNMNAVTGTQFTFNTATSSITNFVRDSITVDAGVTNNVRLGGVWASDDTDLNFYHNGSAKLETDDGLYQASLNVSYFGSNTNKLEFEGGSINSKYAGTTVLDNVSADVLVSGISTKGPFGLGANPLTLKNGAALNFTTTTVLNPITVPAGEHVSLSSGIKTHTFDIAIDGLLDISGAGAYWFNGLLSGTGDVTVTGGTVVFNRTAGDSDFSGTMAFNGITQTRADSQFGTATLILKNTANFRGFNDQIGETIHILNEIEINPNSPSAIPRIASTGAASSTPHTVLSNITFTANGNLSLQATANGTSVGDAAFVDVTGVISAGTNTGNIVIDNEWSGVSYTNGIVRLYGVNTYNGTTTVEDGRVQLMGDASIDSTSVLEVQNKGILDVSTRTGGAYTFANTFRGKGQIDGDMVLTGLIQPGAGTGTLTFNNDLTLSGSNGTLAIEVYGYNGTNDVLANDGGDAFTLDPGYTLNFSFINWAPAEAVTNGTVITVLENWASLNGAGGNNVVVSGLDGQTIDTSNLLVDGTVKVVADTSFDQWVASYNLTGPSALATADPDGDGLSNLYEYGLGGNPTNGTDTGTSPTYGTMNVGGTNYFGYIYPQLSGTNSGLAYSLELTTNLMYIPWTNTGYVVWGTNVTGGALDFVTNVTTRVEAQKYIRLIIQNL
ncbi:MAG: hypothetical protein K9M54_04050 [Kiritimatiellales bacterium]|nr:hypothetical protein [Kiritimatiellales bacterium]